MATTSALGQRISNPTPQFIRWQVVAAFDIITEVSLFGIAVYMTYGLQLSFSNKTVVLLAFALRLP